MAKLRITEKLEDKPDKSGDQKSMTIKTKGFSGPKPSTKISSRSKISKTSKTTKQPSSELNWLSELISGKTSQKQRKLDSGIKTYRPPLLRVRKESSCEYAMFPWAQGQCSGYIKMHPTGVKERSKTTTKMHITVLLGKLQLAMDGRAIDFECGSMITIPKGIHYGLRNPTTEQTVLHFRSITVD